MTIEQRLEQVEQQNQKIQRTNKRLTVALTMMAVVVCAVVTMAATGDKDGHFDTVYANELEAKRLIVTQFIWVQNREGDLAVVLGSSDGDGHIFVNSGTGAQMVWLGSENDHGNVLVNGPDWLDRVKLGSTDNGGYIQVTNKTREKAVQIHVDDYGNGLVGAYNRKGRGREIKPRP